MRQQVNKTHLNLDGSHALAKKGGEAVAFDEVSVVQAGSPLSLLHTREPSLPRVVRVYLIPLWISVLYTKTPLEAGV